MDRHLAALVADSPAAGPGPAGDSPAAVDSLGLAEGDIHLAVEAAAETVVAEAAETAVAEAAESLDLEVAPIGRTSFSPDSEMQYQFRVHASLKHLTDQSHRPANR